MKKKREIRRLRLVDTNDFYTTDELDAINYFHGTGIYAKSQDPGQNTMYMTQENLSC